MVVFDFDGSLSLIRTGWLRIIVQMMVKTLSDLGTGETEEQLRTIVEDFIWRLTGQDTIYQIMELAAQVENLGGAPVDSLAYKERYLERLNRIADGRREELRRGECAPDKYLVPGSRAMLVTLREQGLRMYLASGTDDAELKAEAALLDIARYFYGIHGALEGSGSFSEARPAGTAAGRAWDERRAIAGLRRRPRGNRRDGARRRRDGGRGQR